MVINETTQSKSANDVDSMVVRPAEPSLEWSLPFSIKLVDDVTT